MLAGRSLPVWLGLLSMAATWVGGGYINGTAEFTYSYGLAWGLQALGGHWLAEAMHVAVPPAGQLARFFSRFASASGLYGIVPPTTTLLPAGMAAMAPMVEANSFTDSAEWPSRFQ